MIRSVILLSVLCGAVNGPTAMSVAADNWTIYSEEQNGDVYFYDASRVEQAGDLHRVWTRIRYKTSVMGASSYQSLLAVDCAELTERTLQRTFFSDRQWENPAMSTDMKAKRKRRIVEGSATRRLSALICDK